MNHHYFATNALGWATAPTLEEAIEKLWRSYTSGDTRKWLANSHKEGNFGITFWTCRVPVAADQEYRIEFYAPKVDGLTESTHWFLTYYSKNKIAYSRDPEDTIRHLQKQLRELKTESA